MKYTEGPFYNRFYKLYLQLLYLPGYLPASNASWRALASSHTRISLPNKFAVTPSR